jgi:hypothetical protein
MHAASFALQSWSHAVDGDFSSGRIEKHDNPPAVTTALAPDEVSVVADACAAKNRIQQRSITVRDILIPISHATENCKNFFQPPLKNVFRILAAHYPKERDRSRDITQLVHSNHAQQCGEEKGAAPFAVNLRSATTGEGYGVCKSSQNNCKHR